MTDVNRTGSQIVIEDQDRITVSPTAQVAMVDVRPGEMVEARYTQAGEEKTVLSLRVIAHEVQAP